MKKGSKRATIYFDRRLYESVARKATASDRSVSEIVNEAVRSLLREDEEDLSAFRNRSEESVISYETLLKNLKAHGKL